jgi:beta-glucosidase
MLGNHLWVFLVTICFSLTFSAVVGSSSNEYHRVQSRTWDEAIAMAKSFTAQLNLTEKCRMTEGAGTACEANIIDVPRLNFSGLCYLDSPSGAGDKVLHSTAFAAGIHIAATWDRDLFYKRGVAIGKEFYGKGVNVVLGPMMNIGRNARHGRNWEGFGADPYLSGENAFAYVQGVQDQGVIATAKHYICNEQETNRLSNTLSHQSIADISNIQTYSAYLDDKTIHEIYLWPFACSVAAGIGAVMCSDNRVNGTQACQNDKILNGLLKGELEYLGNVLSDWGSAKDGVQSALGGLDIDLPGDDRHMGIALVPFVLNGTIPESRIDDMVTRIVAPYYLLGQDQYYPQRDMNHIAMGDNYKINRQVAAAGMILLKNTNNILPFNVTSDTIFYVYGEAAGQSDYGLDTGGVEGHAGALYQGGGSGFVDPTYGIDPLSELMAKARDFHLQIRYVTNQSDYNFINGTFRTRGFDQAKCLVFISAYSSEGFDRKSLHALDNGDQLVQTVASHCTNTIVIVNSVSQLNLEAWIDLPNVVGVLWTGMPGSEYGPAIIDVLFGDYNPGGKLVFTLAKNDSDYGTDISPSVNITYSEGVFLDYRHFDQFNITPRYHFGYGLSYTTFSFSTLNVSIAGKDEHSASSQYKQRRMRSYAGLHSSNLYDPAYEITFTITNIGKDIGSEVPQLYLGFPAEAAEPPKVLRGFERVYLAAGESRQVTLVLTQKDISYWNVVNQKWTVAPGRYTVWISISANNDDIKLQSSFNI